MLKLALAATLLTLTLNLPALANNIVTSNITIKSKDGTEVPVEIAKPAGKGPFPPVLFIHAKRGYEGNERAHVHELAAQGFLVVLAQLEAPDAAALCQKESDYTVFFVGLKNQPTFSMRSTAMV